MSGKLYSLLEGSNTVDSFCWKFIPFRAAFLNKHGLTPVYNFEWCPKCKNLKDNRRFMERVLDFFEKEFYAWNFECNKPT